VASSPASALRAPERGRERALAAADHPAHDDGERRLERPPRVRPREGEVAPGLGALALAHVGRCVLVRGDERRDLAAHPGPIREVEVEDAIEIEVARRLGVAREEARGEVGTRGEVELHGEERDVRRDVARAEALGELDAVDHERRRVALDEVDVLEAQIAVAFADPARGDARVEERRVLVEPAGLKGARLVEGLAVDEVGHEALRVGEVLFDVRAEACALSPRGRLSRRAVEVGHARRERLELRGAERAAREPRRRARPVGQPAHVHRPVDDGPGAAQLEAARPAAHGLDAEVDRRRKALVEARLVLAVAAARLERGEVEEAQVDGPFDLPDVAAREVHPRRVRRAQLDGRRGVEASPPTDGSCELERGLPDAARADHAARGRAISGVGVTTAGAATAFVQ